jgi:hypothetical protein
VERATIAREGLTNGVRELERMLDAVTLLSRALQRPLEPRAVALVDVAGVAANGAGQERVLVDPRPLVDLLELLTAAPGALPSVSHEADHVELSAPLPVECADLEAAPLQALFGSLQRHAGSTVGRLAAAQAQLERCGAAVAVAEGRLSVRLPLARTGR